MVKQIFSDKKGLRNRFIRLAFFGLNLVLGASLLVGCAPKTIEAPTGLNATITPGETTPAQPETAAPAVTSAPVPAPAPQPAPAAQYPMEIKDQLGRTVKIKRVPERIISIAPSNTEIIYALGLGYKIVGLDQFSDYPADAKTKASVGSYSNPTIEKIVALNPDLIVATGIHQAKVIPILESMGFTVVALDPKTVDEVLDSLTLLGKITGVTEEAEKVTSALRARIKAVTDKTANISADKKPKVFYVVWYSPLMSSGNGTFQADLIQKAGGNNIAKNLNGWATISLEIIIAADPQIMIAGDMSAGGANYSFVSTEPRLASTTARKNNSIFTVNSDVASRPGPRIVDALEQFARMIHPDLFK